MSHSSTPVSTIKLPDTWKLVKKNNDGKQQHMKSIIKTLEETKAMRKIQNMTKYDPHSLDIFVILKSNKQANRLQDKETYNHMELLGRKTMKRKMII